jgi:hypothetical protein
MCTIGKVLILSIGSVLGSHHSSKKNTADDRKLYFVQIEPFPNFLLGIEHIKDVYSFPHHIELLALDLQLLGASISIN